MRTQRTKYLLVINPRTRKVIRRTTDDKALNLPGRHLAVITVSKSVWKKYRAGDLVHFSDYSPCDSRA